MILAKHGTENYNTRLCTKGNVTRIEEGTFPAINPFRIETIYRAVADSDPNIIKYWIEEFRAFSNKVRVSKKHKETFSVILANLKLSYISKRPILHSRNTSNGNKLIIELVDFLVHKGFINLVIGKNNEYQNQSSWFVPSNEYERESERVQIRIELAKGSNFLCLRNEEKEDIVIPSRTLQTSQLISQLSLPVVTYNQLWLNNAATLNGNHVSPFCRRIFKRNLNLGGRFYGGALSHVNMPKADRRKILINGEPTIEPDYKSLHFSLLYSMVGVDMFTLFDDPYEGIKGYGRKLIKALSVRFVNSEMDVLKRNITRSGNANIQQIAEYKSQEKWLTENQRNAVEGFIENVPLNTEGTDVVNALFDRHPMIKELLKEPDIGLKLQRLDSDIMADCLLILTSKSIPVLPVHDSIRCKLSDLSEVVRAMKTAYRKHTKFHPIIDTPN